MKVLVVGGGGREHALAWKLSQSPGVSKVYCAPGNGGTLDAAENLPIDATDVHGLADFATKNEIGLTVVGPEAALSMGIVDLFEQQGLKIFGANKAAAEIESSKAFSKHLMRKYNIPTAYYQVLDSPDDAIRYIREMGAPTVVKADGLAAGKGVIICRTVEEAEDAVKMIMVDRLFGNAGDRVVIEEFLEGEEASFLAFSDGKSVLPMASSQDHKPAFDNDQGPNTGGMGAYSPAPVVTEELHKRIMEEVMVPTVEGMAKEGRPYKGVLYAGLMINGEGLKVLEFNARFGDPEAQPILPRMEGDLLPILEACIDGNLGEHTLSWKKEACVCVVLASGGYPGKYETGIPIEGLDEAGRDEGVIVFHAGTAREEGRIVTAGGRVLGVTALGATVKEAIERSYRATEKIHFEGKHFRKDIGLKALKREEAS
jgi:phosphoribosylamine--glycine ligase